MNNHHPSIEYALNHDYSFSVSDCLSRAWQLVKDNMGIFLTFTIVYFLLTMVMGFIPLASIVVPALGVGWAIAAETIKRNEPVELSTFFKGFDKFGQLFLGALLVIVAAFVVFIPIILVCGAFVFVVIDSANSGMESFSEGMGAAGMLGLFLLFALFFFVGIIFAVIFTWVPYLIYFHAYKGVEAVRTSYELVKQNFAAHIKLIIASFCVSLLGLLAFGVGLLVAIPVIYVMVYEAYCDITDHEEEDKEMDIIDHFTPMG